ncbi:NADH-ubiquinone oxidoreductase chain 1 [Nowakowskiella sp. JEL0078]|nr:NADH-ubiquinone oxidoreductase chain 1 [Nowakowskiella sp. JEL0078]
MQRDKRRQTAFISPSKLGSLSIKPSSNSPLTSPNYESVREVSSPTPPRSSSLNPAEKKGEDSCHVSVRLRPLTHKELIQNDYRIWNGDEIENHIWLNEDFAEKVNRSNVEFYFDSVLLGSENLELYNSSARNVVYAAMEGINGTVFAYGQTASGKTYSMMGVDEQPGVIPQAVDDVFNYIREQANDKEYLLRLSNETIRDLLTQEQTDIRIHEDRKRGVYVSPLKEEIVTSPKQVMKVIQRGEQNRHWGATDYNEHSSRSHTMFQMIIESRERTPSTPVMNRRTMLGPNKSKGSGSGSVFLSQLNLIDLAGSEKATTDADRRKEGAYINKSLLTLGTVISKLTDEKGVSHVPFRDSKLTRILQSSLSGNSNISVICTVSPASNNWEETLNTFKFASRVKKVTVSAKANQVLDDKALLQKYRNEISDLRSQLLDTNEMLEKTRESVPMNVPEVEVLQAERLKMEEELQESMLVRTALKERIDHLTKLILSSQTITSKPILDWSAPTETGDKRASVILDGLLPHVASISETPDPRPISISSYPSRHTRRSVYSTLSRTTADKDMIRRHIADIDTRDEKIRALENVINQIKPLVQNSRAADILANLDINNPQPSEGFNPSEQQAEIERMRRDNQHLEIVCADQSEKIDSLERQLADAVEGGEQAVTMRGLVQRIEAQDRMLTESDALNRGLHEKIAELRNAVRSLEGRDRDGSRDRVVKEERSVRGSGSSAMGEGGKIRDLERALEREKWLRALEGREAMERVADLEAQLTLAQGLYFFALIS